MLTKSHQMQIMSNMHLVCICKLMICSGHTICKDPTNCLQESRR
uniref:Uncharacterized protein n=1 Tax=Arundo donax TaxID=35708 RepID=A0A0A9CI43_ARUDO